jgi:hypothetical protein
MLILFFRNAGGFWLPIASPASSLPHKKFSLGIHFNFFSIKNHLRKIQKLGSHPYDSEWREKCVKN